jgi:hypothetical protein
MLARIRRIALAHAVMFPTLLVVALVLRPHAHLTPVWGLPVLLLALGIIAALGVDVAVMSYYIYRARFLYPRSIYPEVFRYGVSWAEARKSYLTVVPFVKERVRLRQWFLEKASAYPELLKNPEFLAATSSKIEDFTVAADLLEAARRKRQTYEKEAARKARQRTKRDQTVAALEARGRLAGMSDRELRIARSITGLPTLKTEVELAERKQAAKARAESLSLLPLVEHFLDRDAVTKAEDALDSAVRLLKRADALGIGDEVRALIRPGDLVAAERRVTCAEGEKKFAAVKGELQQRISALPADRRAEPLRLLALLESCQFETRSYRIALHTLETAIDAD